MNINPTFLELSFDRVGIRNSQKRLKELIRDVSIEPLKQYQDDLRHKVILVEEIVARRVAKTITYWLINKADPVKPDSNDMMSSITNASKNDISLHEFYISEVKNGVHSLAPILGLELPNPYEIETEELEYALIELEDKLDDLVDDDEDDYDYDTGYTAYGQRTSSYGSREASSYPSGDLASPVRDAIAANTVAVDQAPAFTEFVEAPAARQKPAKTAQSIVVANNTQQQVEPVNNQQQIDLNVLDMTAERAWQLIYDLIGYNTEYIQGQMIPRWTSNPETFEKDRRFLYQTFIDTVRNALGVQMVAGNHRFSDRPMTIDQMWNYYYTDLSRNIGPMLSAAKLDAAVNDPWYRRWWKMLNSEARKISPVWVLVLIVAIIFDGLTTYVSLDQTPMEGFMVIVFTGLITILFQIADVLVIDYRKREFEADGMVAKYRAQFEKITKQIESLDTTSDSYVQMSQQKSKAIADWKASEDNRKMARRGRFWSARIADINIVVTAYGFAFMFLNAEEPMYALYQQIEVIRLGLWESLNLWIFLMIGLAITVSFVINTAQRTEILGWSMRRLRNEG